MESATQRFFNITELILLLTNHLDRKGISCLMRTSRQLQELCTQAHYRDIPATYRPGKNNIFGSAEPILALSKNVHHVRELDLGIVDLVYYFNCIVVYQDRLAETARQPLSRPLWLAPPDPHLCPVLPIPPMTLLTKIVVDFERMSTYDTLESCPYSLPSYRDQRAISTQVCWILQLSPHLQRVVLKGFSIRDDRDIVLFTTSIFGLEELQELSLSASYWTPVERPLAPTVFFSCPPSLQALDIELYEYYDQEGEYDDDYDVLDPGEPKLWADKECGLTKTPRRQGPLRHLTSLDLKKVEESIPEAELISILQHCPNLLDFGMPDIGETQDADQLAATIVESCPALNELTYRNYYEDPVDGVMMLRIMSLLSPQQVRRLHCDETPFTIPGLDVASLFRRHSVTLQTLTLRGCLNVNSKAIQALLVECRGLQVLLTSWADERHGLCIDLEDAIEFPWRCTSIQTLHVIICVPDEPLYQHLGVEAYYKRSPLTALSAAEKSQFEQLEVLYRQVGTLTQVENLCLGVVFYNSEGIHPLSKKIWRNTFPGMLSLGDKRTGRPGYLHHLAGLAKLRRFNGSVSAGTDEARVTVGLKEAEWMRKHWPALEFNLIFPLCSCFNDVIRWLGNCA